MAIPQIKPYSLPTQSELPINKVDWQLDASKAVLLIHDMQEYFLNFYQSDAEMISQMIQNICRLKAVAKQAGIPVIYTAQPEHQSLEERGLLTDFWGAGLNNSTEQKSITNELAPDDADTVLTKWRYSAFKRSPLHHLMDELDKDQIIICGIYAHIGCMTSACDAFMRDIKPFMVADGLADFTREDHLMALNYVAKLCGSVNTTNSLIDAISERSKSGQTEISNVQNSQFNIDENNIGTEWTIEKLVARIASFLQVPEKDIDCDESLIDYGLDSIRVMTLVEEWRSQGLNINFQQLAENPTINGWHQLLLAEKGE
ncbi:isochorismatase [Aliikangiella coralliicola]|uniref:isochorismatase n=1 Tax=Aliikangiella coralliicola TaxID=2592383 RepID=A0A545UCC1_9GAMM|nr:isochorismatase [Aliikangiella coralliicola]TQV87109.1 isochorismatase [Aliikangiella coralliicola]